VSRLTKCIQIVPKHSAILSAYPNRSIHANHMQMTKFSGTKDAGYVSVSDQLWLWVDTLQKEANAQAEAGSGLQMPAEEVRERRNRRFGTMQDVVSESQYSGSVNAGGGPVFQGNLSAGRDFNVNMGSR
jgi:protein SERAC1